MTKEELNIILEKHKKWLNDKEGGECANLSYADLSCANLRFADLSGADLRYADLSCANLRFADLSCANLSGANLSYANLRYADLSGANLRYADLSGADLSCADLDKKEQIRKGICLSRKMVGYKKCRNDVIVKLEIPKGAIVFSINNNKCRTNIAKCVAIENGLKQAISQQDKNFIYKVGKTYTITDFNCQYNIECAEGIYFFRTKKEAEEY